MAKSFAPITRLKPGGAMGAPEPAAMASVIFAIFTDDKGVTHKDLLSVVETTQDVPGDYDWAHIREWTEADPVA